MLCLYKFSLQVSYYKITPIRFANILFFHYFSQLIRMFVEYEDSSSLQIYQNSSEP